jgi:nitroreductase
MSVVDTEPRVQAIEITRRGHILSSITLEPLLPPKPLETLLPPETTECPQEDLREESGPLAAIQPDTGAEDEHVFEAIRQRRSVGQVTQQEPTRAQIERLLEAATYAPSHHVTEPWEFFVITGAIREELGRIMAASLRLRMPDHTSEKAQMQLMRERNKPLRAPVIITVAMKMHNMQGLLIENIEAAGAAVQNMLLAAQEMGLATLWRTGDTAYDPFVKSWLGMGAEDHIVGFIYVGYPKVARQMRAPTHYSVKTTWL